MSKVCDLTGKRYMSGNNVSHANNRTKRKFDVNLRSVNLESETLKEKFRLKIAASTMRTISKKGGFDKVEGDVEMFFQGEWFVEDDGLIGDN
mgnify:CR=1 FL=1